MLNAIDEGRYSFEELKGRITPSGSPPSTRSLRRYLAILADAGFPWFFDRPSNVYRFADGYSLKRLALTPSDLFGLVALKSLGASVGGTIGEYIDDVTERLVATAGSGARERVRGRSPVAFRLPETRLDEAGERAFALLASAERDRRSVEFTYQDKEGRASKRRADPYGFIMSSGRIYCVAFDHARKAMRTFAVDNATDVRVTAKTFVKPSTFDVEDYASASISGVLAGSESIDVRVRFDRRVAKAAIAARAVAEQQIARREDGGVDITYRVSDVDELVRWVLGWGAQAEIVEPPGARRRIAELARSLVERYP